MAEALILFDGVCNFCNWTVNFVIDRDSSRYFCFAPLQSPVGERMMARAGLSPLDLQTLILVKGDRVFTRSSAALRIARRLRGPWRLLYVFILVPHPLRDAVYDLVARNRYRWFGRTEACRVPTPELRSRFVGDDPDGWR